MSEPADILVFGLPRDFHYGPGMGTNPILMGLAIGAQFSRCAQALRPDPVIIAVSQCDGWFNKDWFPSYEETYVSLQNFSSSKDFLESDEAKRISTKNEYLFGYSNFYTYIHFMLCPWSQVEAYHLNGVHKFMLLEQKNQAMQEEWDLKPLTNLMKL